MTSQHATPGKKKEKKKSRSKILGMYFAKQSHTIQSTTSDSILVQEQKTQSGFALPLELHISLVSVAVTVNV